MSLSFPTLPDSLDIPRGGLGWGPRTRHLVLTRPAVPLGRIRIHKAFEWEQGQDYINFTALTNSEGSMVRAVDMAR
ncbi:uncharacterized protein K441DRAFT_671158 [Cenococcum geophilum 1.58]|uniref:Uncharacterized protein n=1 Tax=Cenococcum geophilum 1.58 TaxID=794803 RepID=A0ACC8ELY8_9PEZI|nr:hypothetical protein K441DRAFT_671158 [Cenococcum geophilum 1.58]